jgi:hypothetical protein
MPDRMSAYIYMPQILPDRMSETVSE